MKISAKNVSLFAGFTVVAVAGIAAACVVASLPEECAAPAKVVHVSIDDCWQALDALSDPNVKSVYDVAFFKRLREWNERYGAKFTCYIYGNVETSGKNFDLANVPEKFKTEFSDAAGWLKFGFHAPSPKIEETKKQTAATFEKNLSRVNAAIERFAGNASRSDVLRLDYFFAEPDWLPALQNAGTKTLLGPDSDGRTAYSLTESQSAMLRAHGFIAEETGGGIEYVRTDARFEQMAFPWWTLSNLRDRERIVVFTHEWAMGRRICFFMEQAFGWFREHGYEFTFLEN